MKAAAGTSRASKATEKSVKPKRSSPSPLISTSRSDRASFRSGVGLTRRRTLCATRGPSSCSIRCASQARKTTLKNKICSHLTSSLKKLKRTKTKKAREASRATTSSQSRRHRMSRMSKMSKACPNSTQTTIPTLRTRIAMRLTRAPFIARSMQRRRKSTTLATGSSKKQRPEEQKSSFEAAPDPTKIVQIKWH